MKVIRFGLIVMAAAMIIIGLGGTATAFHDGGVAHCDGCHSMHNSQDGTTVTNNPGAHLLKGSDASSTCLTCHAAYGQFSDGSAYRAGGDFYWVTRNYSWSAHGHTSYSSGDSHGHNILAADYPSLTQDATLSQAPGGTYDAGELGCDSCHDPHGKGGNEVLLWSPGPTKKSYPGGYTFTNPAPIFANAGRTTDVSDNTHSAYVQGMSEFCANCHTQFLNAIGKHVAGNNQGASLGNNNIYVNYNSYYQTGVPLSNHQATAYLELVPFEGGGVTLTDTNSTAGPSGTANVACVSCHRAHATPFPDIGRWFFSDTLMLEDSHPMISDTGASASDVANKWYGRVIPAGQRSFCNKCHVQD